MNNKKDIIKYLPGLFAVVLIWFGLSVYCFLKPADDFSDSERAPLSQFPEVSLENVLSGKFMKDFEEYSLDQFPMRDSFRTLKALTEFNLFGKLDNNNIYVKDGYATEIDYPLNEKSVEYAANRFSDIYNWHLKNKDVNIYMTIVPGKSYYLADKYGYPTLDFDKMVSKVTESIPGVNYIDITSAHNYTDYYYTDTHWRQEKITGVAKKIASAMNTGAFDSFEKVKTDVPFYGVYYGQAALPLPPEDLYYLTNDTLQNCKVKIYDSTPGVNKMVEMEMYSKEKLNGKDPYEMFLYGGTPVAIIENPEGTEGKELVILRDSYGSSIAPLLVKDYAKVTVLDTRYMSPGALSLYITKNTDDVLFLYSSMILNSSYSLKQA